MNTKYNRPKLWCVVIGLNTQQYMKWLKLAPHLPAAWCLHMIICKTIIIIQLYILFRNMSFCIMSTFAFGIFWLFTYFNTVIAVFTFLNNMINRIKYYLKMQPDPRYCCGKTRSQILRIFMLSNNMTDFILHGVKQHVLRCQSLRFLSSLQHDGGELNFVRGAQMIWNMTCNSVAARLSRN